VTSNIIYLFINGSTTAVLPFFVSRHTAKQIVPLVGKDVGINM